MSRSQTPTPRGEQVGWLCHTAEGQRHFIWLANDDAEMDWLKKRYVRLEPLSVMSETVPCTLCAAEPGSDGFYTGCMVKDGHAPEWDCDGKGNLTRRSAIEPSADEKRYRWLRRNGDKGIYVIQRWTQGDEHSPLALAQGGELDTIIDEHIAGTR